jgi:hypothetical protein
MNNNNSILHLSIYVLKSTANSQLQSQHEYKQHQEENTGQNKQQINNKTNKNGSDKAF